MKNYSDAYLLGNPYQLVASGWDSHVFIDTEDNTAILKLYESLTKEEILAYYALHDQYAQKGIMKSEGIAVEVLNPIQDAKTKVINHEDGMLVVLPRVDGVNLSEYGTAIERSAIHQRIKKIMGENGLPTTGGFEVKLENLTVVTSSDPENIHVIITDLGARIEECLLEIGR